MSGPVRLQLARRKGFDLQALSRGTNGLEAINVARPSKWGNPFIVSPSVKPGSRSGGCYVTVPTIEDAVECFREMLLISDDILATAKTDLAGKNLACWCPLPAPGEPDICHAAVLLEIANREPDR